MRLILASQSPRRRQLLSGMGFPEFITIVSTADETVDAGLPPGELVCHLSERKADSIDLQLTGDDIVIAADTIVVLNGAILGKPETKAHAFSMLFSLSGRAHEVYTGITVKRGEERYTEYEVTTVYFRPITTPEIEAYIETGEPMDKAGSYGIQGIGALFAERIEGDYFNVMGLPVFRLAQMLKRFGVDPLMINGQPRGPGI